MTRFPPAASPSPAIDGGQSEEKRWRGIQGISLAGLFFWLLLLSFLLTVFSQWTAMAEMHYRLADPAAGM